LALLSRDFQPFVDTLSGQNPLFCHSAFCEAESEAKATFLHLVPIPKEFGNQQELSFRKQIARQLRTQYVEVIYDNPVTLKSRLTVTQGH